MLFVLSTASELHAKGIIQTDQAWIRTSIRRCCRISKQLNGEPMEELLINFLILFVIVLGSAIIILYALVSYAMWQINKSVDDNMPEISDINPLVPRENNK